MVQSLKGVDSEENIVLSTVDSGNQLILKQTPKVKFESLTVAQWCAANCNCLKQLASSPNSQQSLLQYLEYMKRICELAEHYEWQSILAYDKAFRSQQESTKGAWDANYPHLDRLYLRVRQRNQTRSSQQGRKCQNSYIRSSMTNASKTEPCWLFNIGKCRYEHVCSVAGCNDSHPQIYHVDKPTQSKN